MRYQKINFDISIQQPQNCLPREINHQYTGIHLKYDGLEMILLNKLTQKRVHFQSST